MAHLITGAKGQAHITPKSDAVWHRGLMGVEGCILDFGEKLAPALVPSQPTNIRILDGCGMMQGRFFEIEEGSYDTVAIPNGAQGYNRIDIVCAKITQNENGTQTFSWQVVQGTQTSGTPEPPTVAEGSLDDGDEFALMPIASVELEGVNIVAVETVAEIGRTVSDDIRKVVPLRENEFIEVKKLLWTNPNPTSKFTAQTIALDLSDYDYVEIEQDEIECCQTMRISTANGSGKTWEFLGQTYVNTVSGFYYRSIGVVENGISVSDCQTKPLAGGNRTVINQNLIPYKIYGIKHI